MKKFITAIISIILAVTAFSASGAATRHPDFETIRRVTTDPKSDYYYPRLLQSFLSNDTTMTADDYHYFYYGTMFQEDYNPYRPNSFAKELEATTPLYYRHGTLSRSEKDQILKLSESSLRDNPLNLTQLMYRVYVYEQNGKYNLAKIWKHKLNNLLLTISRSGTGADAEHAYVVVYPSHEYDFFNLSGISVEATSFEPPYYERLEVRQQGAENTRTYYFDLHHLLEQYYLKHPSELTD